MQALKSTLKPNIMDIPITVMEHNEGNRIQFNKLYKRIKATYTKMYFTESGGLGFKGITLPCYWIRNTKTCIDLVVNDDYLYRIQYRFEAQQDKKNSIYGRQAFYRFANKCQQDGIDIYKYVIKNGEEVKKTIPQYMIKTSNDVFLDFTFKSCHHVDFHNSFPAGLVNTHPEFRKTVEYFYQNRKVDPINKAVLNLTIGFMQSLGCCNAQWAHLSKDAITDNNNRVAKLAAKLEESGRTVLLYNTDGIWYTGDIYHGEGEGKELGQWENDHVNCTFRMKSRGAYEFIENDKYTPVIRGKTKLDTVKPREEWSWGDIYRCGAIIQYAMDDEQGIIETIMEEEDDD